MSDIQSINTHGLELYDSLLDFNDLAFIELLACAQEFQQALRLKMEGIRSLNNRKKEITDDLQRLNEALEQDGDTITVTEPFEGANYTEGSTPGEDVPENPPYVDDDHWNPETEPDYGPPDDGTSDGDTKVYSYSRSELEDLAKDLEEELENLSGSSQIELIDLNRLLNQYQQTIQLVSTMESREHQTVMQLINNIK